jgi:hypothetical protein
MTPEVRAMIDARHAAEQRGLYSPLGRLLWLQTQHGMIQLPETEEGGGPDIAGCFSEFASLGPNSPLEAWAAQLSDLLVLGQWSGLPSIRVPSTKRCPVCLHDCDACAGKGVIQCNGLNCGGRGWVSGNWISCPGPGCHAATGKYNPDCEQCHDSPIRGQIAEHLPCPRCKGTKLIQCERCRGTLKFSTGKIEGALDYRLPSCKACDGTGTQGAWQKQDVKKFTNARLRMVSKREFLVLGPIQSFALHDFETARPRIFDVTPDEKGDLLVLIVPASGKQKAQKAYLVGGVVKPRDAKLAVGA